MRNDQRLDQVGTRFASSGVLRLRHFTVTFAFPHFSCTAMRDSLYPILRFLLALLHLSCIYNAAARDGCPTPG